MFPKPRPIPPPDAQTLPARYYTDAQLFDREMERIFARRWIAAGRVDEVSEPGSFVTRIVGRESLIIVCDRQDRLQAFFNVCRHRGTRICSAPRGNFGETIQCPYHAWTYGLDGRLVGAPHMDNVPGFNRDDYPLHRVAVDEWDGHIFLHLTGGRDQSLRQQLDALPEKFRAWQMGELRLGTRIVYDVRANWKLIIQNYSECLHCPIIHPALNRLSHYLSGENEPAHSGYIGGRMDLRPGFETFSTDGLRHRGCLPGLAAEDRSRIYFYAVLPNLLLSPHPDYVMTQTLWPRACDRTEIVSEWLFHPDQMSRPDFTMDDVITFWDETNRQDWHVSELSQLGIASRAYSPGPYSDREDLLYQFDRMIVEMLE